ncbi:ISL3 family transposase [Raineyella fluvialis]|uniref:ISL3 family transposase n=1 Tax=Raineyella fluvialis TaxID=2662261 RepID=A0A5Q2F6L0_9ACTN|nr:ISL3 family transposase [Raineyella fluvialis]
MVGQQVAPDHTVLVCHVVAPGDVCPACGQRGTARDMVTRRLAHVPFGWWPTILHVRVRRYRCSQCRKVWRQDLRPAASARAKLSRDAVTWALRALVIDRMSVARIAQALGVAWNTANKAVLAAGRQLLIADPARLGGVEVIGVDEHVWRHTRHGERYVTVIIDLTPIRDHTGPARLLDMVEGRSKKVFKAWLADQTAAFRARVEVVAMDGFTGFKTAAVEELPDAAEVMDPFHVVALAGDKLDQTRQRIQQATRGHRGRSGDPLYGIRRALRTSAGLLTDRQIARIGAVFADDAHVAVEATWGVYQRVIEAYRQPSRADGKQMMTALIASISHGVPKALGEVITLGRTLKRRRTDILAYFDHPGTSNGPTEAINGRLEHLRGTALGFRNLVHYRLRALLDTGGFRPRLHSLL